ncbi:DUF6850 family outer membrane beta-barrel protein [Sphingobacterium sp.]|uniref:DUF6850 family outer membrane beta-barrel protein n=1 Tax=Sphingobacterium sp. TaxID=341027 RepID=UPI0028A62ABE|nr:DUF6850 family outer membrane beta-barrel protein [Sphingobacterium sp.]
MLRYLSTVVLCCCFASISQAQDSLSVNSLGIKERMDISRTFRNTLYESPALRPFQYQQSLTPIELSYFSDNKDRYTLQRGSGDQGFRFNTESYQKEAFPNITLWGEASYESKKIQDLKFNETSDFEVVFPYLTADSVGGDLNSEMYQFSGGMAKEIGKWVIGGEAGYRANLSHRKVDPRPENNSSNLHVGLGASYQILPQYLLSANLGYQFYKQRNKLTFLRELGKPPVYYMNGLGAYNKLLSGLSGESDDILYEMNGFDGKISFLPRSEHGFFIEAGFSQKNGNRKLSASRSNANDWTDQIISGKIGYLHRIKDWKYGGNASMELQTRKGVESLFHNDGSSQGLIKISEISSYRYYNFSYHLEAIVGKADWTIKPYADFTQFKEQYVNPFREQMADMLNVGVEGQYLWDLKSGLFGISLNLQKQKLLKSRSQFNGIKQGTGIADMLQENYNYLTAEPFSIGARARYDFVAAKQIKPFVQAEALSATEIKQKYYSLTIGLMF